MTAIDPRLSADMLEAARLTREARLSEATLLIQRLLRGKRHPSSVPGTWATSAGTDTSSSSKPSAVPPTSKTLRGFLEQFDQRGVMENLANLPGRPMERVRSWIPDGARFETAIHAGAHGSRAFKLYVPSGLRAGQPVPLVVMLHGCTQSAAGTQMNELAEEQIFLVAYPAQPASANAQKCWNGSVPVIRSVTAGSPL